ncbi:PulJ/GspJ family protein [Emcibacter nanhaiensis]|uniref:Prepilin-type N-terminal cleavage/methylation domain-containing protein n=1 Tax=Emcibacter nanhaiensis TaxID=1505037 RepID=A0A501PI68_9PROT|nr:prepilin-type N-terminal cleavage/methylation domain-containing protein [Emcibacter nanhaiensis]TPD60160.1 prepilin-type N-terminal cleavage/methylation domain-containing protein [Emcibacter nanhaiensis]
MSPRPDDKSAGFTLLEILISIALLSLIMLMITGIIGFSQKSLQATEQSSLELHADIAVKRLLKRLVEQAAPAFETTADEGQRLAFSGTSKRLDFLVRSPIDALPPGLYRARLALEEGTLHLSLATMNGKNLVEHKQLELGPRILGISYYQQNGDRGRWSNQWSFPSHGPDLIRIACENPDDGDQTETIGLYIRPLLLPKAQENENETDTY